MQTSPTQTEILLGGGMPHVIEKLFSQIRVKYQGPILDAFHCFIVWSSLLCAHPDPHTPPRYSNGKAFFPRYLHKEGIR